MALHGVDYAIIVVIGLSVITGLFRGLIKELIALCVWILAFWLAMTYSSAIVPWLAPYIQDKTVQSVVAFILILVGTVIVGGLFNALLSVILRHSGLSGTDRLLGMGFGFVRGVFIVALMIMVTNMTSLPHKEYTHDSRLYAQFNPMVDWMQGYMPALMKKIGVLDKKEKHKKKSMTMDTKDIIPENEAIGL